MAVRKKKDSTIVKAMKMLKSGEGDAFVSATHGVSFTVATTTESAGVGAIPDAALALLTPEMGVTRVVSQYATSTVLDKLKEYFDNLLGYNLYDLFPEIKENL